MKRNFWLLLLLAFVAVVSDARHPRGFVTSTTCVGQACGPVGSFNTFSPLSAGAGQVVTITALSGSLQGAIPSIVSPLTYYSGLTIVSGGQEIGTVFDGSFTTSPSQILYTVPADGATGQFFFGNQLGISYYSGSYLFTFIPTAVPAAPTGLSQSSGNAEVDLTWTPVPNGASYNIWRSNTSGSGYTNIGNTSTASTYSDMSVTNGNTYYYVVTAVDTIGNSANSNQVTGTPTLPSPGTVTVSVTPGTTQTISPYIYGVNGGNSGFTGASNQFPTGTSSSLPSNLTLDRFGGDRLTAYNWETNNSNCGADCGSTFPNDNLLYTSSNGPATAETQRITWDQSHGMALLITFQLQGLVAADASGSTNGAGPPNNPGRFDTVQYAKGSAFTINPSPGNPVYMDEYAYNINNSFSGVFTTTTDPVFMQLDNEPDIWYGTHPEIQTTTEIAYTTFVTNEIALATALKNQYPTAKVFGPVISGWTGLTVWQGSQVSWTPTGANWMIDYYAQQIHSASSTYGHPLVDIFDFHWYPQVTDPVTGGQISESNGSSLNNAQVQAIVQTPRSLYDSTYVENSWIPSTIGNTAINLLPRFNAKLAAANPGMQLAITEYFPGGGDHIAGTIAEADMLGAFGANNVYASNLWPLATNFPAVTAGFRAFRNFDGAGANFGNTSVLASSSNIANVSAYVSTDTTQAGRVVMVLINRSNAQQNTTVSGITLTGTAHLYQMTESNIPSGTTPMTPVSIGTQSASGTSITIDLPEYSVTTVDIH